MQCEIDRTAEIAALKAEVERLTKREGILVDHMSEMLTKAKDNPEQQASFLEIAGYCIMELDRADKSRGRCEVSIRSDEQNIIAARNREIAALKAEVERFSNDDLHVIYMALHKLHADLIHRGESEQANKVEAIKNKVNNDWVAKLKAEGGAK